MKWRYLFSLILLLLSTPVGAAPPSLNAFTAGAWQHSTSASSLAATIPNSFHVNDCMFVICATASTSVTWTAPTGFSSLWTLQGASSPNYWIGWKRAVAGDVTGSVTVTCSSTGAANNMSAVVVATTNGSTTGLCYDGIATAVSSGSNGALVVAATAVNNVNDMMLGIYIQETSTSATWFSLSNSVITANDFNQDGWVDVVSGSGYAATGGTASGSTTNSLAGASGPQAAFMLTVKPAPTPPSIPRAIFLP